MATLGGKSVRTVITSLEVLSDDRSLVLMLDSMDGLGGGGIRIRTRKPWESQWSGSLATWTVGPSDAEIVSKIIANHDAQYQRSSLDAISSDDFSGDNPDIADAKLVDAAVEARCSQLDIERAKAANMKEERELLRTRMSVDHIGNKHGNYEIEGCEMCANRIRPVHGDGSLDLSDASRAVQIDAIDES
jgi:hypothetical protein